jgi:ribosomal protein S18 acetylase RimI-like enzyme
VDVSPGEGHTKEGRITFTSADRFSLASVTQTFNRAFTGYYLPMSQTTTGLAEMMRENDVRLDVSVVASLGTHIAGISLLAIREGRGWIAGMGIDPRWRRQGLGRLLLLESLERLGRAGAQIAQLEALAVNSPALMLYASVGFQDTRELRVYQGLLRFSATSDFPTANSHATIRPIAVHVALGEFDALHAIQPAWQREERTLAHIKQNLAGLGLWINRALRGYLLYLPQTTGYILYDAGSAAASDDLRQAQLVALLHRLAHGRPGTVARAINVPPGDPLGAALEALQCPIIMQQREMTLTLGAANTALNE